MRTATKVVVAVGGAICLAVVGILIWSIASRDICELHNATRVLALLEQADRLQQSDPLKAYNIYGDALKETREHNITDSHFLRRLADAERSRMVAHQKVQATHAAKEAERQRQTEEGRRAAAEERRLAEEAQRKRGAEESRRTGEEKRQADQERHKRTIAAAQEARNVPAASKDEPHDLKGDRLGMSLQQFKAKYTRKVEDHNESAPFCSDTRPGQEIVTLLSEAWHSKAGIVNCSITFPFEAFRGNAPTIADVKTKLLVHHFVDGKLYTITAWFPHDGYVKVIDGLIAKYGPAKHQETSSNQNRLGATFSGESLLWANSVSTIMLTERFGDLDTSALVFQHRELSAVVAERTPKPTGDDL